MIRARRVRFDWDHTPVHWVPGDPQTTHTANVLHLLLPAGEKWFVEVYRQVLPLVTDGRLRDDVKGFMGQEAVHSRAHAAVLDHLAAQGIDTRPYTAKIEWLFERLLGDQPLGRELPPRVARVWLRRRLAIIAAIEHFTAVLGAWVISDSSGLDDAGADPTMLDLLRWHGAEEVEHRSVAFDLARHAGGSYPGRVLAMGTVLPAMLGLWVLGTAFLLRRDPHASTRLSARSYLRAARRGLLPGPRMLAASVPRYLRPGYHPSQEGDSAAAAAYLSYSPAARAAAASTHASA